MTSEDQPTPGSASAPAGKRLAAVRQRDAAMGRLRRARRWLVAGTAVLSGGLAAVVSVMSPGRTLAAGTGTRTGEHGAPSSSAPASSGQQLPPLASPSSLGLQGPSQPPTPVSPAPSTSQPAPSSAPSSPSPAPSSGGGGVVSGGS